MITLIKIKQLDLPVPVLIVWHCQTDKGQSQQISITFLDSSFSKCLILDYSPLTHHVFNLFILTLKLCFNPCFNPSHSSTLGFLQSVHSVCIVNSQYFNTYFNSIAIMACPQLADSTVKICVEICEKVVQAQNRMQRASWTKNTTISFISGNCCSREHDEFPLSPPL